MPDDAPEFTVQVWRHPRGWIMVPLQVSLQGRLVVTIGMMLNTGRPRSLGVAVADVPAVQLGAGGTARLPMAERVAATAGRP